MGETLRERTRFAKGLVNASTALVKLVVGVAGGRTESRDLKVPPCPTLR
jgi:hypothetical protein